jgi:hypothetical protein
MKRLLFLAVLAVVVIACLGLLASPAFAGKSAPIFRPPTNVPILGMDWGGSWMVNSGVNNDPAQDLTWYDANDPTDLQYWAPLPLNTSVIGWIGWTGSIYGQIANVPHQAAISIEVSGPGGFDQQFSPAQTAADWTGPFRWDAWWTAYFGSDPLQPFNPKSHAGVYINYLVLPLGPFPTAGLYHFHMDWTQTLPFTDLIDYFGTGKPTHVKPGPNSPVNMIQDFDFYVGS